MRSKANALDEMIKSIVESDDDATRSSSGAGSSAAGAQRKIDLSLLRLPILTAVTGFLEAYKAYESGTEEVRKLLSSECDLLYDCRVCRNMFRSLTNFISHKRVYCQKLFNAAQNFHFQNDGFLDQDVTTIVQAEKESLHKPRKAHVDVVNKDLSSIVERLRRKQYDRNCAENNLTQYYDKVDCKIRQDDLNRQQHVLQLDNVPQSQAAVYQTVRDAVTVDNMRTQVGELEELACNNNTVVLGIDGKILDSSSRSQSTISMSLDSASQYFKPIETDKTGNIVVSANDRLPCTGELRSKCPECNMRFHTESMLQIHIETKHTPSAYVYPCPSCPEWFFAPYLALQHLSKIHNKAWRRIKVMRNTILKRRTRIDEFVVKAPSREVSRLLQSANGTNFPLDRKPSIEEREEAATRAWMENLENFDHGPMCSYCGKTFERKAVLTTHKQTCAQRIRQMENGAASVPPSSKKGNSSGRRSKVKELQTELKIEPVDSMPASSDESNSYDVPLATLQSQTSQFTEDIASDGVNNSVLTIKPEDLASSGCAEDVSRRKRKKPAIVIRNASDDISFELEESEQNPLCKDEEFIVPVKNDLKEYVMAVKLAPKAKRKPRSRKKPFAADEISEKDMKERIEVSGEIVCRCSKRFTDPEKYKRHLRVFHSRQRRFWCAVCDFKGYRKVDTVNHLLQEHDYKGDQQDINSLINFQSVEKDDKILADDSSQSISSIINTVSRNCDTSATDIGFSDVSAYNSSIDVLNTTHELSVNLSTSTQHEVSPNKRARHKIVVESNGSPKHAEPKSKIAEKDDDATSPTSKRPIRNRIKPVDKDFVYDLTHLLQKEEDLEYFPLPELVVEKQVHPVKAKSEPSRTSLTSPEKGMESKRESLRSHAPKPNQLLWKLAKGAAYAMAKRQVDHGLAALIEHPDIPEESALKPARIYPLKQPSGTTMHDWQGVKKDRKSGSITKNRSDIQIKRKYMKRTSELVNCILPELIREKRKAIPRRNSIVSLPHKISVSMQILNRLNSSHSTAEQEPVRAPTAAAAKDATELRQHIETHLLDHRAKLSQVNINGTTVEDLADDSPSTEPRKRITLMQRLQDNKDKRSQQNNISPTKQTDGTEPPEPSPPVSSSDASAPSKATESRQDKLKKWSSL